MAEVNHWQFLVAADRGCVLAALTTHRNRASRGVLGTVRTSGVQLPRCVLTRVYSSTMTTLLDDAKSRTTTRSLLSRLGFATAATATVVSAMTGSERLHRFAKPLIVPALAVGVPRERPVLLSALTAATIGDILLIDPDDDSRILRGASAFAVMQGCYCALLASQGARVSIANAVPRLAGWTVAATLLGRGSPAVAPGLAGYGLMLAVMSTLAADPNLSPTSTSVAGVVVPDSDPRSRMALGGILFAVSDALIAVRRLFLRRESHRRIAEGTILATYAVAQLFLVEGLAGEK